MPRVDLDFQRYVERRKGRREAEAREGAAYAYAGDLRLRKTLDTLRPVKVAIETTAKLWRGPSRAELLDGAVRLGPGTRAALWKLVERAAERLRVEPASILVTPRTLPAGTGGAVTIGAEEEPVVLVEEALLADLDEAGKLDVFGRELGRIQNGQVLYGTAHFYLEHHAARFVRWVVAPAKFALDRWARRGEVTADRAGLLASRDLEASSRSLVRRVAGRLDGVSVEAVLAAVDRTNGAPVPEAEPASAVLVAHPDVARRLRALRLFAESGYFRGVLGEDPGSGLRHEAVDAKVAEVLSS